jgi:hypothetical protein
MRGALRLNWFVKGVPIAIGIALSAHFIGSFARLI